jgi:hypothetical protein
MNRHKRCSIRWWATFYIYQVNCCGTVDTAQNYRAFCCVAADPAWPRCAENILQHVWMFCPVANNMLVLQLKLMNDKWMNYELMNDKWMNYKLMNDKWMNDKCSVIMQYCRTISTFKRLNLFQIINSVCPSP